jgi:hypothetical protein
LDNIPLTGRGQPMSFWVKILKVEEKRGKCERKRKKGERKWKKGERKREKRKKLGKINAK